MRAVRSAPPGVEVVDVDEPEGPGALVRIRSASICASDLGYIAAGSRFVLGHELAGTTEDGTAVTIEAIFGCGACDLCEKGLRNLCATTATTALGVTVDGGMSEWYRVPESALVPLPAGLAVADASLVEPAAVSWHALRLCGVVPGMRVAVVGGGALGLLAVAGARAMGVTDVGLEARYPHQVAIGEALGARTAEGAYDVVIEAAGSETALARSAELARPGGSVGILGLHHTNAWPFHTVFLKEVRLVPSIGYCSHERGRDFSDAAAMLAADPAIGEALITHRFPLEDAPEAFRVAADKTTGALRVVLEP